MSKDEITPFSENALRRIAQIIELKYQGIDSENVSGLAQLFDAYHPGVRKIREFFRRAGCGQDYVIYDGEKDTYWSLALIQRRPDGREKLIRVIEQLCDPEEYFNDPANRNVVIKQINEVLSRYNLKVTEHGKVLTSPLLVILDNTLEEINRYRATVSVAERDEELSAEAGKLPQLERMQQKVFVCYSHKDIKWLEQLQVHLKPLENRGIIDLWDDTKIPAGAIWREEIENAIEAATIAIILVSPYFLASDFISKYELPTLLSHAETKGTRILSVILSHCLFDGSGLDVFQTVNSPSKPLKDMTRAGRDKTWVNLAKAIQESLERRKA
jgi:TIR domain-containing protein